MWASAMEAYTESGIAALVEPRAGAGLSSQLRHSDELKSDVSCREHIAKQRYGLFAGKSDELLVSTLHTKLPWPAAVVSCA